MSETPADTRWRLARRHSIVGWWGLLVFLTLGLTLEALHGYKIGFYLDPANRIRRLMWTLAHAHGTLIAIVHLAFAAGLGQFGQWTVMRLRVASFLLIDALLLLPLGFFLGGIGNNEVDPSPGILLVPMGGFALLGAVALIAWSATLEARSAGPSTNGATDRRSGRSP